MYYQYHIEKICWSTIEQRPKRFFDSIPKELKLVCSFKFYICYVKCIEAFM